MAGTREVPLSGGAFALIDDDDMTLVSQYKWHINDGGYAVWRGIREGRKVTVRMHRLINNTPDGFITDHKNHNRLDNRRSNLRTTTQKGNMANYRCAGVCFDRSRGKWLARYKGRYVGRYSTKDEALRAYQLAKSGVAIQSNIHPRRRLLPKNVLYMLPMARAGRNPYYVRPTIDGKRVFKGYFSTVSQALEVLDDMHAEGGLTS